MQIIGLDARTVRGSGEVLAFLGQCPFVGQDWPGWGGEPAAKALLAQAGENARWWAASRPGQWQWLLGLEALAFDSQVFGRAMGRLAPIAHREPWPEPAAQEDGERLLAQVLGQAWHEGLEGLVARVGSRDFLAARVLEAAGFCLADLSVEWLLELKDRPLARPEVPAGLAVRPWRPADEGPLMDLAAAAFCDLDSYADRFALDPVMRPQCPELYRRWLGNCFGGGQADMVLVLEADGAPQGFITLKKPSPGDGPAAGCGWVNLNAIAPGLRGQGLYNLLLRHGLEWLAAQGARRARVRTKLSQGAVIRAWSRLGARQVYSDMTFHLWRAGHKETA
ncbi:MAG: GNAT family N-acetyltransferase [Desulfarculus sp.]|nr:GNAT family N-acetyltransferase [Desulfarculus sp.]